MLEKLKEDLIASSSIEGKIALLDALPLVNKYFNSTEQQDDVELILKSLFAIGQEKILERLSPEELCEKLLPVEKFYREMGGIVGYHWLMHSCLGKSQNTENVSYLPPEGINIAHQDNEPAITTGIDCLPEMAEIYPLGGAADRLNLHDEKTGEPLPAAKLSFCGKTLLEWLIEDLQAREYLYFKKFGKQIEIPIAIMTSAEKENHQHILAICEEKKWFGRRKENFRFFCQPLVPTLDKKGNWAVQENGKLVLKPGGHGVIWKLARDEGVIEWLMQKGCRKALVRQINNPVAGLDYGLLALTGWGLAGDYSFGFASCERLPDAAEGVNVLVEKKKGNNFEYVLSNIEYCDVQKHGLSDLSKFSANANILFVDLKALLEALITNPIPGMLVNLSKDSSRRLESTMQNIADSFVETYGAPLPEGKRTLKRTFLTLNDRRKTLSTIKKAHVEGAPLLETPEGCFLDLMHNAKELLRQCGFSLSEAFFFYHPALGPLYSDIAQKLRGGHLAPHAELRLRIASLSVENLSLDGSLHILADNIMGEQRALLQYSEVHTGKCTLKNVTVRNAGLDRASPHCFWKDLVYRTECCRILLHGNGEFHAENVTLDGNLTIEVPSGTRMEAVDRNGKTVLIQRRI